VIEDPTAHDTQRMTHDTWHALL